MIRKYHYLMTSQSLIKPVGKSHIFFISQLFIIFFRFVHLEFGYPTTKSLPKHTHLINHFRFSLLLACFVYTGTIKNQSWVNHFSTGMGIEERLHKYTDKKATEFIWFQANIMQNLQIYFFLQILRILYKLLL